MSAKDGKFAPRSVLSPYTNDHKHFLTKARILEYLDRYGAKKGPGFTSERCTYCASWQSNWKPGSWTHAEIIAIAAENKIGFSEVLTIEKEVRVEVPVTVEVPVDRIVMVPFSQTLSFGENASLTASLQHGQHLLNDDLRLAMLNNDTELIALSQARLVDHLSLMEKLGVARAEWTDNHNALLRAGRIELPLEETSIWSRA